MRPCPEASEAQASLPTAPSTDGATDVVHYYYVCTQGADSDHSSVPSTPWALPSGATAQARRSFPRPQTPVLVHMSRQGPPTATRWAPVGKPGCALPRAPPQATEKGAASQPFSRPRRRAHRQKCPSYQGRDCRFNRRLNSGWCYPRAWTAARRAGRASLQS